MEEQENAAATLVTAAKSIASDPDWLKKVVIGGLISPFPVANFLTWGYTYRVFVDGLNAVPTLVLPTWGEWRTFFRVGFWIFVITLVYVVLAAFGITAAISLTQGGISGDFRTMTLVGLGSLAVFNTVAPVVFTRFAEYGRVWACFEPDAVLRDLVRVVRLDYVQLVFLYYGLWTMSLIVFGGLPIVGVPFVCVSQFVLTLLFSHVFGRLVGHRKKDPPVVSSEPDPE